MLSNMFICDVHDYVETHGRASLQARHPLSQKKPSLKRIQRRFSPKLKSLCRDALPCVSTSGQYYRLRFDNHDLFDYITLTDGINNFQSFINLTKTGMFTIEMARIGAAVTNKKL